MTKVFAFVFIFQKKKKKTGVGGDIFCWFSTTFSEEYQ